MFQRSTEISARHRHQNWNAPRSRYGDSASVHGTKNGIIDGSWMPRAASAATSAPMWSSTYRSVSRGVRTTRSNSGQ
jgi:hypothetical protein